MAFEIKQAINDFLDFLYPMKLNSKNNLKGLKCNITEINEQQDYSIPNFPLDNMKFGADSIYKMPLKLNVRVFVYAENITEFESRIEQTQLSDDLFNVTSLYNKVYRNLKIESYARDTNNQVLGGAYYNIAMKEVILVSALVSNFAPTKKGGYSSKNNAGTRNTQKVKRSTLKEGKVKAFGS